MCCSGKSNHRRFSHKLLIQSSRPQARKNLTGPKYKVCNCIIYVCVCVSFVREMTCSESLNITHSSKSSIWRMTSTKVLVSQYLSVTSCSVWLRGKGMDDRNQTVSNTEGPIGRKGLTAAAWRWQLVEIKCHWSTSLNTTTNTFTLKAVRETTYCYALYLFVHTKAGERDQRDNSLIRCGTDVKWWSRRRV